MRQLVLFLGMACAVSATLPAGEKADAESRVAVRGGRTMVFAASGDRGLTRDEVMKYAKLPRIPSRPTPVTRLADAADDARQGDVRYERVGFVLSETADQSRKGHARFGFPLPRGAVFSTRNFRLLDARDEEQPVQTDILARWPDGSLKWVLATTPVDFAAGVHSARTVEYGNDVRRAPPRPGIVVTEDDGHVSVDTGALRARVGKRVFRLLESVGVGGRAIGDFADGLSLTDAEGVRHTSAGSPFKGLTREQEGPETVVLRADGEYGDGQRYIARMRFFRDSPVVVLEVTHINANTEREFTDLRSLEFAFHPADAVAAVDFGGSDAPESAKPPLRIAQVDDRRRRLDDNAPAPGQLRGTVSAATENGGISVAVRNFRQRWPKGISVEPERMVLELLPRQRDDDGYADLPWHLRYPFVDGNYRAKWGMSFTECVAFDFSAAGRGAELAAGLDHAPIPLYPPEHYLRAGIFEGAAGANAEAFSVIDRRLEDAWALRRKSRAAQREYGYLNHGDTYGERTVNWNNNEYDYAYGLLAAFARTGSPDYCRRALEAARHQADVDIVHAYPDPYYVGANHQHSIAHTGIWQAPKTLSWSHRYDKHTSAENGHTWARGMALAWCLTGDFRIMDALYALGDHIAFAMAPNFRQLTPWQRSAGWSLPAICGIYAVTLDAAHLEAAGQIADVALREQRFDRGGAWPMEIPRVKNAGETRSEGNTCFQMGVLLNGLAHYHRLTRRDDVRRSLEAGVRWLAQGWDDGGYGWYYDVSWDGVPLNSHFNRVTVFPALNPIIAPPLIYVANLADDAKLKDIAFKALKGYALYGVESAAKPLSQKLCTLDEWLGGINRWTQNHPEDRWRYDEPSVLADATRDRPTALDVQQPARRTFDAVLLRDGAASLSLRRLRCDATKRPGKKLEVRAPDGAVVFAESVEALNLARRIPVEGRAGDRFAVVVDDDASGAWSLMPSPDYAVEYPLPAAGATLAFPTVKTMTLVVEPGARNPRLRVYSTTLGRVSARLLDEDGKPVAAIDSETFRGENLKNLTVGDCAELTPPRPDRPWRLSLALWSTGTVHLAVEGADARLTLPPREPPR